MSHRTAGSEHLRFPLSMGVGRGVTIDDPTDGTRDGMSGGVNCMPDGSNGTRHGPLL